MKRIGIISDTHGCWDEKYEYYLGECDEIWHAGDIGSMEVADKFEAMKPTFRAVYGNCDNYDIRSRYKEVIRFKCEDVDVLMTHIGGYPGKYDRRIQNTLLASPPNLFVDGHSHILKVMNDKSLRLLHINPGAAGHMGWHEERTIIRLTIEGKAFTGCDIIKLGKNNSRL
jgi:hypothetical protein